jgi:hypothetical protein
MGFRANPRFRRLLESEIPAFEIERLPGGAGSLEESAVAQGMKGQRESRRVSWFRRGIDSGDPNTYDSVGGGRADSTTAWRYSAQALREPSLAAVPGRVVFGHGDDVDLEVHGDSRYAGVRLLLFHARACLIHVIHSHLNLPTLRGLGVDTCLTQRLFRRNPLSGCAL